ncbi:MAG: DNA-processing protein DprA [Planctomycetota bacterium]
MRTRVVNLRRGDPEWPDELDRVEMPPEELWARGRTELLALRPRVAIVGTRAPTAYGRAQAERFAGALAAAGVVVVSGLARGVDACAHLATLERGGATVAVVGSGVDRPWPEGEATRRTCDEGLVLSELAPGTPPRRHHFPLRNRLIAGLSSAVVVVEAAARSGSLITARWAVDQGKDVFAIPGRVDDPMAAGCHELLAQGARVATTPTDVLRELAGGDAGSSNARLSETPLLAALAEGALGAADAARRAGLSLPCALAELAELELDGRVARAPGGLYRRLV